MVEKPMTTGELFSRIQDILKERSRLPDILDYGLPTYHPTPIRTYRFDLKNNLDYGSSEGIYTDLWIEYYSNNEKRACGLGTFKTLDSSDEAMHLMAGLLADFIIEESVYIKTNLDDFNWEGADVYPLDEDDKRINWGYCCSSMKQALKKKEELLEKDQKVIVRDNTIHKETIFCRQTKEKS